MCKTILIKVNSLEIGMPFFVAVTLVVCEVDSIQSKAEMTLGFLTANDYPRDNQRLQTPSVILHLGWDMVCQMIFLNVLSASDLLCSLAP